MKRIFRELFLMLSIFEFVASDFNYQKLKRLIVTNGVNQSDYEPLYKVTKPLNDFKLDSFVDVIPGDLYSEIPTFTAIINRPFHVQKKVYVKLVSLKNSESVDLIIGYFSNLKSQNGYMHLCQTAKVLDHDIAYWAIEMDYFKTVNRSPKIPDLTNASGYIVIDYVNKFKHPDHATVDQLKGFQLERRIDSEHSFVNSYHAQIFKVDSTMSFDAIVMIYYCAWPSSSYSINTFQDEIEKFKLHNPNMFIRIIKNAIVNGYEVQSNSIVVAEVYNENLVPFQQWIGPNGVKRKSAKL